MKLELDIDLNAYLSRRVGWDPDEGPIHEPATLETVVIDEAARAIAGRVDRDALRDIPAVAARIVKEEVTAQVRAAVAAVMEEPIQKTNHWGEPEGPAKTLRAIVVEQATGLLSEKHYPNYWAGKDSYHNRGESEVTLISWLVREVVTDEVRRELQAALNAGKQEVVAALRNESAQIITQTIERLAGASRL